MYGEILCQAGKARKGYPSIGVEESNLFNLIRTSHLIDISRICWDEVQVTVLYTDPTINKKQDPHTDNQLPNKSATLDLAWTAHLPINKVEGSHIYLWKNSGYGTAVHIPGGQCLLLQSDVVHSGGVPDNVGIGRTFIRLHFYLPTKSQKPPPLGETIYRTGYDGAYYFESHWHIDKTSNQDIILPFKDKGVAVKDKGGAAVGRSLKEKRIAALKIQFDKEKFLAETQLLVDLQTAATKKAVEKKCL